VKDVSSMGDYNFKPVTKVGASIPSNKVGASIANGNPVQPRKDCPNLKFGFAFAKTNLVRVDEEHKCTFYYCQELAIAVSSLLIQ